MKRDDDDDDDEDDTYCEDLCWVAGISAGGTCSQFLVFSQHRNQDDQESTVAAA